MSPRSAPRSASSQQPIETERYSLRGACFCAHVAIVAKRLRPDRTAFVGGARGPVHGGRLRTIARPRPPWSPTPLVHARSRHATVLRTTRRHTCVFERPRRRTTLNRALSGTSLAARAQQRSGHCRVADQHGQRRLTPRGRGWTHKLAPRRTVDRRARPITRDARTMRAASQHIRRRVAISRSRHCWDRSCAVAGRSRGLSTGSSLLSSSWRPRARAWRPRAYPDRDRGQQVGATLTRCLGEGRVGEMRGILDAGALFFGRDLAREIGSHMLEIADHRLDRGNLARLLGRPRTASIAARCHVASLFDTPNAFERRHVQCCASHKLI